MALQIDEANPCAAAKALRNVYIGLIAGQASQIITFRAGPSGVERSVTFHKADAERLMQVIRDFERQCAAAEGRRPRRHGIFTGGVR